jgi:DNA-binding CsgD family transcriptional regulator
MPDQQELSERELEILKLVATGVSNKEIAQRLYISTNTVKVHLKNIFAKIGAVSRTEAAMYAVKIGLVQGVTPEKDEVEISALQPVETIQEEPNNRRKWVNWVILAGFIMLVFVFGGTYAWQQSRALSATATNVIAPTPSPFPRWQEKASMLTARKSMAVAAYEYQIFAMAGETETGISDVV